MSVSGAVESEGIGGIEVGNFIEFTINDYRGDRAVIDGQSGRIIGKFGSLGKRIERNIALIQGGRRTVADYG